MIVTARSSALSRGLIIGSPNTGKTSFLSTIKDEKVIVISFPDEKGIRSIPIQDNITPITFTYATLPEEATDLDHYNLSMTKYQETLKATRSVLSGKLDTCDILFLDGLSKFYEIILDITAKGKYLQGRAFDTSGTYTTRIYGQAHVLFRNYLSEIYNSSVCNYIISTSWEKLSHEDENSSDNEKRDNLKQGKRVWLPALPGQMASLSTGEFDWCIRTGFVSPYDCTMCKAFRSNNIKGEIFNEDHFSLQLKPFNDVQCVGIKGTKGRSVPTFIHQEWKYLKQYI